MSIVYCENCDRFIDTDFNVEHFEECDSQSGSPDGSQEGDL